MEGTSTQKQWIRDVLEHGGSITALEALRDFGCYRLASRISDLRKEGLDIKTEFESSISKITGKPVSFARYSLNK